MYHNLPKIKDICKDTFDIDFPDVSELMKAISKRHDLVHRNGKRKNGVSHNITKEDILTLRDITITFVQNIEIQLNDIPDEDED